MSTERRLDTEHGPARLVTDRARSPVATLLLSHGAGNGIDTHDLAALARGLPRRGVSVVRLEQPWKVAGRRVATAPPSLDVALAVAARSLRPRGPLVVGGRSAGARSAARSAGAVGAAGCLALAFPLHPPGRPERSRLPELLGAGVPTLVVQGERDLLGRPAEFPADLPVGIDLVVVPAADHGFAVAARGPLSQHEATALLVEVTWRWLERAVLGRE